MLSENHVHGASDLLFHHWQDGRRMTALPQRMRPSTRAEGYAIQALLEHRTDEALFGWKIAATSLAGQAHIGVDGPLAGRLLKEKAFGDGAHLSLSGNAMRVAEPEFAFRMARDLVPRSVAYGVDEGVITAEEVGWDRTMREMRSLIRSEDAREGPLAFAEKREPVWKAR